VVIEKSIIKRKAKKISKIIFLVPSLVGVLVFVLIPFIQIVIKSFFTSLSFEFVGIKNYVTVIENEAFQVALFNSMKFILLSLPLLLSFSLLIALVLYESTKFERTKYLFLYPLAMPAATIVLIWQLFFCKQGLLNKFLNTDIDFLNTDSAFYVLAGSYIWKNLGYTIILWIAGLKSIPKDMIEAAKVDGANAEKILFRIIFPNLSGCIYMICVISLINSFKVFREAYLVSGAYPQESMYLVQHVLNNWYTRLDFDKLAAAATLVAILLSALSLLMQHLWDKAGNGYE